MCCIQEPQQREKKKKKEEEINHVKRTRGYQQQRMNQGSICLVRILDQLKIIHLKISSLKLIINVITHFLIIKKTTLERKIQNHFIIH